MVKLRYIALIICFLTLQGIKAQTYPLSDSLFRSHLRSTYSGMINSAGDLVIAEANKITGTFSATQKKFTNVDGIQHFNKVSRLILAGNKLKTLPDISAISNLNTLDLSNNELLALPSFSKLKKLKFLDLQQNKLVQLPDLLGVDSLQNISAQYNNIDTIPDLSHLTVLKEVWMNYNYIRSAKAFENVKSLQSLVIYKNEISNACDFSKLTKLQELNIGYNKLKIAPIVGNNKVIEIIYANDNMIDSLPDSYAACENLTNVRLYNNPLTFKQLMKLTALKDYNTLVKLNPQPLYRVGYAQNARENTSISLQTGIDPGVPDMYFNWYKDGSFFKTTLSNELRFVQIKASDAGSYYCVAGNNQFSEFSIQTDTFKVNVYPCNDLSKISFEISDIECLKAGTVQITDRNAEALQNTYILKSNVSEHVVTAKKLKFTDLTEPSYTFTVRASDGCEKTLSTPIQIVQQECEEVLLYPNNEGNNSYYFEQTGEVIIYDKRGSVVKKLAVPGAWTGQGLKGQKVPSGFYVADINNGEKLIGITVLY